MSDQIQIDRRHLLQIGAAAAAAAGLASCAATGGKAARPPALGAAPQRPFACGAIDVVRVGVIGVGGMGTHHVRTLQKIPHVEVRAICDIHEGHAARAVRIVKDAGHKEPTSYTRGERDYERMCAEADLDVVYIATPWRWHVPMAVAAMENGKHVAIEVPAATSVEGCWQLVETAERTRRHAMMLENCCYDRPEMMCLNMVRQGLLGEVLHGEGAYAHDLRPIKFSRGGEGLWRRAWSQKRNANLYPTHGLGPVAQCMDIHRGDAFDYLVSMSGPSRGLQDWQKTLPEDDPRRQEKYALGDVNVTMIKTRLGRTIHLVHDTNLPRPYTRLHTVQGTRGIFQRWPDRVHVEGKSPGHRWQKLEDWKEYEHPLWRSEAVKKASGGHGGMDFLESYRLIECLRGGLPTDMNVYDAAAWSVVVALTEKSVANRSAPVDFPDFTRGKWKSWPKLEV